MTHSLARSSIISIASVGAAMLLALQACGGGGEGDPAYARGVKVAAANAEAGNVLVVRAQATLAGGIGAEMDVRANGLLLGSQTVSQSGSFQDYRFALTAPLSAGDKVDVVFTNDAVLTVDGVKEDRNLLVESITVNGSTLEAFSATLDVGEGAAAFDGITVLPGRVAMPWNAALRFVLPTAPAAGVGKVTVNAHATPAGGTGALMAVRVDGQVLGSVYVNNLGAAQDYTFWSSAVIAPGARIDVVFLNDAIITNAAGSREDRNLIVESVTVNDSTSLKPTDQGVVIDQGSGPSAFDGLATVPGQNGIWWNGALRMTLPGGSDPVSPVGPSKLPHTGITEQQCYRAGSDEFVSCSSPEARELSGPGKQDGMYAHVNALSYGLVPRLTGGSYDMTQCVKDKITDLVWEGKEASGPRGVEAVYTNWGNGAEDDASGYVVAVNSMELCGFKDWRLPTVDELHTLLNLGTWSPSLESSWLTTSNDIYFYWTSVPYASEPSRLWTVYFGLGYLGDDTRGNRSGVRLVHSSAPTQTPQSRYIVSANRMEVQDDQTGLTWRRCAEGMDWTGSNCSGNATLFTHEEALAHARDQVGWRLPNEKELQSLTDRSRAAPTIDANAFPSTPQVWTWSSTPYVPTPSGAWGVSFEFGNASHAERSQTFALRLVRAGQ